MKNTRSHQAQFPGEFLRQKWRIYGNLDKHASGHVTMIDINNGSSLDDDSLQQVAKAAMISPGPFYLSAALRTQTYYALTHMFAQKEVFKKVFSRKLQIITVD